MHKQREGDDICILPFCAGKLHFSSLKKKQFCNIVVESEELWKWFCGSGTKFTSWYVFGVDIKIKKVYQVLLYCHLCRFQGRESCSCPQTTVEDQFSSLTWDGFSGEVLNSLYITSPISMHCNQSTAELFPVSTTFKPLFHYLRQTGSHPFPMEGIPGAVWRYDHAYILTVSS